MEPLNWVLTLNIFQFNGENYQQVGGTAMGIRVAPSYANIFMSQFEEKHVYTYRLKPLAWYRYIDNVFCIWQHGDTELNNFVKHLNNMHDTIKFSMETSRVEISFLDTMVKLENGKMITDLYCSIRHTLTTAKKACRADNSSLGEEYAAEMRTSSHSLQRRQPSYCKQSTQWNY